MNGRKRQIINLQWNSDGMFIYVASHSWIAEGSPVAESSRGRTHSNACLDWVGLHGECERVSDIQLVYPIPSGAGKGSMRDWVNWLSPPGKHWYSPLEYLPSHAVNIFPEINLLKLFWEVDHIFAQQLGHWGRLRVVILHLANSFFFFLSDEEQKAGAESVSVVVEGNFHFHVAKKVSGTFDPR